MGSPLGPILANIFTIELENSVIPGLANQLNNWRRYIDDLICYTKVDSIGYFLSKLNNFRFPRLSVFITMFDFMFNNIKVFKFNIRAKFQKYL